MATTTLTCPVGESKTWLLTVTTDGARQSLTGLTIEFEVRTDEAAPDPPLIARAVGTGITLRDQGVEATKGQAELALDPAQTESVFAGEHRYSVRLRWPSGKVKYPLRGRFILENVVNGRP